MATQEIRRDDWVSFFDSFSRQHAGWLVTVEVSRLDIGAQTEARELPLDGISADLKGPGSDKIAVVVRTRHGDLTHTMTEPLKVRLQETEQHAHQALQIESADGTSTIVRFRSTMPTERVDGFVRWTAT